MSNRWILQDKEIVWRVTDTTPHTDTMEMSGHRISAIVTYGVKDDHTLYLKRELRYPQLRTLPKDTYASLGCFHEDEQRQCFEIDGEPVTEYPYEFRISGWITICSRDRLGQVEMVRSLFPSMDKQAYIEHTVVRNRTNHAITVSSRGFRALSYNRGSKGIYPVLVECKPIESVLLESGDALTSDLVFSARCQTEQPDVFDGVQEFIKRQDFVREIFDDNLVLESTNDELNCMFRFTKLRAAESIFDTAAGPLHSPGGGAYYAAIWANDQAEYVGPFFPYLGYDRGNEASYNAYTLFRPFMADDLHPIPSSIIDEGRDIWEGAGDRGDAAMVLYGASRFLLALGDRKKAVSYMEAIDWCVRYCRSRLNEAGVIASDTDELEGRFPSGNANLCTSCLTYGGLIGAAYLAEELDMPEKAQDYRSFASQLRSHIDSFFGAKVSGYDTYRYYEGNDQLRSWICIPLTMGIFERREQTIRALLSDRLFKQDGLVCVEGNDCFWDRSTLYALRGILNAGHSDDVYPFLKYYVNKRLLTEHVPYPVEAYPEGNQRHLSAESGLFARIVVEGLAGITPTGFSRFELRPSVPKELGCIKLRRIRAFDSCFTLEINRQNDTYHITVTTADGLQKQVTVENGGSVEICI